MKHDLEAIQEFFDGWELYQRVIANDYMFHAGIHTAIAAQLSDLPAGRILDVGCGDAAVIAETIRQAGWVEYEGVDLSPVALELAEANLRAAGARPTLHVADFVDHLADAPAGAFDTVVAGYTLHHITGPARSHLFDDLRRVLRPGGVLLVYDVFMSEDEDLAAYLARNQAWRRETWSGMSVADLDAIWSHVSVADFPFSASELAEKCAAAGFGSLPVLTFEAPTGIHRLYAVQA